MEVRHIKRGRQTERQIAIYRDIHRHRKADCYRLRNGQRRTLRWRSERDIQRDRASPADGDRGIHTY